MWLTWSSLVFNGTGICAECCQQVNGGDPCPLLSPAETYLGCWVLFWALQYKRDMDILEEAQ
ncbi:hypothetical protein QYF61_019889 [Mycteria americana]|uniref:Uncharacterized protein n=1 Tax=Mycteria americana TaxID=33587 RepID=A0AAN7PJ31_MYCAM|nr:hypothetical protein QYF61_019889 [Mycteria americana]